jgi:hypothetical protein
VAAPRTYEQIFAQVASDQVVLVSGEQDNVFVPGYEPPAPAPEQWPGLVNSSTMAKNQQVR